ncbi:MAG TPA: DNA-binding domain-containing protein [Candidatus Dormibacteraeota bacterium]|nr:DNA-binding domain-containing protein [Candidatus Dormibacteraeota bacterium]
MKLLELQRTMARAVMQPLTFTEHMQRTGPDGQPMRAYAARFIKPNDRLTSFERLEIYNRQYWFRLLSSMVEDFPGLRAVLGAARFEAMSKAYITDCPSRSFTLRNLGSQLESWLHKNPRWAGKKQALALDIVKLEWAEVEAFDGKAEPPLRPEDLAVNAGANLRLRLQPYIQLFSLRYPVDDLLLGIKNSSEENEVASNAFQERRKRKRVQSVAKLKPAAIALAVHRIDNSVYFRRLEPEEFALLTELKQGRTLQKAVDHAFSETKLPPQELPALVQRWFHNWAALGWFCQPAPKVETSARSKNRIKGKRTGARRKIT